MNEPPKRKLAPVQKYNVEELAALARGLEAVRGSGLDVGEAAFFCAAACGSGVTIAQLTKKLGMPFSTASRVAWSLAERGLLRYDPHPTDRRKKLIRANLESGA